MTDRNSIIQIFGDLMKRPQLLSESDKYCLTPADFSTKFDKYVFAAIDNLYRNGATRINPIDIENYLETNAAAKLIFKQNNGIEVLQDAEYLSEESNFNYYYQRLKKFNLLNELKTLGIDTSEFYIEDLTNPKSADINQHFEELNLSDIVERIKRKVLKVEKDFVQRDSVESWDLSDEIDNIVSEFGAAENIGKPINGEIINTVLNGAALNALTIRSAASGVGKTSLAVADACKMAYPFYYDVEKQKWVPTSQREETLFIMTEQTKEEVVYMILAYLTGIERSKFRFNALTPDEKIRLAQAKWIIKTYKTLHLMRIPDPNIEQIRLAIRENVITNDIKYVFYDYIFISPSLLSEFRGMGLRNDELLLLMATALKDLAIEQNICIFTSTQVNAKIDDNSNIRNEASLAGGRATINKADNGVIYARPTKEELDLLGAASMSAGMVPNIVADVFKVRSGRWTQVRVWSYFDTGSLRLKDLFITDNRLNIINDFYNDIPIYEWEVAGETLDKLKELERIKE